MNFYRIIDTTQAGRDGNVPRFECRLEDAGRFAKGTPKVSWADIRVELVDIETDKEAVCAILNHDLPTAGALVLRTWSLSQRGALIEVNNGD